MKKFIFSILSLGGFTFAIYFTFSSKENFSMTAIWLAFSIIMLAFGWPAIVESISFAGAKIKLREVNNALSELKQLTKLTAMTLLNLTQGQGRWGGLNEKDKIQIFSNIREILNKFGFSKKDIIEIESKWHEWVYLDYIRKIIISNNINHPEINKKNQQKWLEKREELIQKGNAVSPDELREVFKELEAYSKKIESQINDYEYYMKYKKHKNIDIWLTEYNK